MWTGKYFYICFIISKTILSFNVPYYQWTRDGAFSKYSSESGYKIVSEALIHGIEEENI